VHDHTFVFRDYIEVVLDKKIQDQYHDNNHDKLNNHVDQVHAMFVWEDILHLVYIHLMMGVEGVHLLQYKMLDKLHHVLSMECHQLFRPKVLGLNSSPDL
jgi:hypothetical protein